MISAYRIPVLQGNPTIHNDELALMIRGDRDPSKILTVMSTHLLFNVLNLRISRCYVTDNFVFLNYT